MSNPQTIHYSYEDIHNHTLRLLSKIEASFHYNAYTKFDYIVGISRGGLIPATILSHNMDVRLYPVVWSTRDHGHSIHCPDIADDIQRGAKILLVDDINDTGRTFIELLHDWMYSDASTGKVVTASVFQRFSTRKPSDHYSVFIEDNSWIGFPWEKK